MCMEHAVCLSQVFHQHYTREKQFAALIHKESVALLQSLGIGEGAMEKVKCPTAGRAQYCGCFIIQHV